VKKKYIVTATDKKDWITFTKQSEHINKIQKLDLHGFSLDEANKIVKKFVIKSFENGYKQLLIITGKGSRSKVYKNPYLSKQMNVLKYSVPEFINNDENLINKVSKISGASLKDGGEGAFYIFLKKKN